MRVLPRGQGSGDKPGKGEGEMGGLRTFASFLRMTPTAPMTAASASPARVNATSLDLDLSLLSWPPRPGKEP